VSLLVIPPACQLAYLPVCHQLNPRQFHRECRQESLQGSQLVPQVRVLLLDHLESQLVSLLQNLAGPQALSRQGNRPQRHLACQLGNRLFHLLGNHQEHRQLCLLESPVLHPLLYRHRHRRLSPLVSLLVNPPMYHQQSHQPSLAPHHLPDHQVNQLSILVEFPPASHLESRQLLHQGSRLVSLPACRLAYLPVCPRLNPRLRRRECRPETLQGSRLVHQVRVLLLDHLGNQLGRRPRSPAVCQAQNPVRTRLANLLGLRHHCQVASRQEDPQWYPVESRLESRR